MKDDHVRERGLKCLSVPIPSYQWERLKNPFPLSIMYSLAKECRENENKKGFCHGTNDSGDFNCRRYTD